MKLVLALHFHQPVGNFDHIFEEAVTRCYEPIIEHFERYSSVRAGFHFSGCLLEWLEQHNPSLLDRLFALVNRDQVEPLGGGFYEPILPVILRDDAMEQLERLSQYWKCRCGFVPKGAWLAERVWEPSLAELLADAGISYTFLDDQHVRFAGVVKDRITGLFVTERHGKAIGFYPSDYKLRYLIPFRTVDVVKDYFTKLHNEDPHVITTYGDDAEKFGLWPGTYQWVYAERWLDQFFQYLQDNRQSVQAVRPIDVWNERPEMEKIYIPNASYSEMLEWALPPASVSTFVKIRDRVVENFSGETCKSFLRGSLWDMFLARYPESDQMLKHTLRTLRKVRTTLTGDLRERALTHALRAQCNCAYWHGLFGGLYLPHLRHGVFSNVLEADAIVNQNSANPITVDTEDFDGDLEEEVIVATPSFQAFFRPQDALTISELDYLPSRFNISNVVSRWKESYHMGKDLTHAQKDGNGLVSPHEVAVGIRPSDIVNGSFDELPLRTFRDFVSTKSLEPSSLRRFKHMTLARGRMKKWETHARGWSGQHEVAGISYQKSMHIRDENSFDMEWRFPQNQRPFSGWFGTILCLSLLTSDAPDRWVEVVEASKPLVKDKPSAEFHCERALQMTWKDRAFAFMMNLSFQPELFLVTTPIQTLQRSEKGYEEVYQGTMVAVGVPMGSNEHSSFSIKISFGALIE